MGVAHSLNLLIHRKNYIYKILTCQDIQNSDRKKMLTFTAVQKFQNLNRQNIWQLSGSLKSNRKKILTAVKRFEIQTERKFKLLIAVRIKRFKLIRKENSTFYNCQKSQNSNE